ncbi:MAG: hypothetical protein VX733_05325 [Candidatus Latescibacterota bacterium]|nr:hypothetical protein [Candidatus Latescibacterota bacterium]
MPTNASRRVLCGLALVSVALADAPLLARSSVTIRTDPSYIAGPGIDQSLTFHLYYFPGDGEAIVSAEIALESMDLVDAEAAAGIAEILDGRLLIDYSHAPVGDQTLDTVRVQVRSTRLGEHASHVEVITNIDTDGVPGHRETALITVSSPLQAKAVLAPERIYPGESLDLTLSLRNIDDRELESLALTWPDGLTGPAELLGVNLAGGAHTELSVAVEVAYDFVGPARLEFGARGGGLTQSPLEAAVPPAGLVPEFSLQGDLAGLRPDRPVSFRGRWTNPTSSPIPYRQFSVQAPAGVTITEGTTGIADVEQGVIRVDTSGQLEPGQSMDIDMQVTAHRVGPLVWRAAFQPPDRESPVSLPTRAVMRVIRELSGNRGEPPIATDLELAAAAFRKSLTPALRDLPLESGQALSLVADAKADGNWLAKDLLIEALIHGGYRVQMDHGGAEVPTLHYRLTEVQVLYESEGRRLLIFGSGQRREARVDLLLWLVDAADEVVWARRVQGRKTDSVPGESASWLGGAEGIEQGTIAADNRFVEIGLSGLIVSGLFFIFFAP